jgi:carbonic anhydrase
VPALTVDHRDSAITIVNNGHSIQVDCDPGSSATFGSDRYELLQFHFHSPSEHTVDGKHLPIEMHLVRKNEAGKLAVIGVFFEEGDESPALGKVWAHLAEATAKPTRKPGTTATTGRPSRCTGARSSWGSRRATTPTSRIRLPWESGPSPRSSPWGCAP